MPYARVFGRATMQSGVQSLQLWWNKQRRHGRLEILVEVETKRAVEGWVGLVLHSAGGASEMPAVARHTVKRTVSCAPPRVRLKLPGSSVSYQVQQALVLLSGMCLGHRCSLCSHVVLLIVTHPWGSQQDKL